MCCQSCNLGEVREYTAEINIHFPGVKVFECSDSLGFPQASSLLGLWSSAVFDSCMPSEKPLAIGDHRSWTNEAGV